MAGKGGHRVMAQRPFTSIALSEDAAKALRDQAFTLKKLGDPRTLREIAQEIVEVLIFAAREQEDAIPASEE